MTRPDKCPECGAALSTGTYEVGYECGSFYTMYSGSFRRSMDCLSTTLGRKLTVNEFIDFELLDFAKETLNQHDVVLRDVI